MTQSKHSIAQQPQKTKKGFTLVEVIIAGAIFSFLLIVAIGALVNALTIYAGANISRDNQQDLRNITEEIGRRASFATDMAVDGNKTLCIRSSGGDTMLYYQSGEKLLRKTVSTQGNTCAQTLAALGGSLPSGGDLISATSVQMKTWDPKIVTNIATGGADTKTTISVDLTIKVARPASEFVGLGTTHPPRLNNTFEMHVAFFALNN